MDSTLRRQTLTIIPHASLGSMDANKDAYFVSGGYYNDSYYVFCEICANRSRIRLNSAMHNGQNVLQYARIWVFYR